jgi:hypothetical protein
VSYVIKSDVLINDVAYRVKLIYGELSLLFARSGEFEEKAV